MNIFFKKLLLFMVLKTLYETLVWSIPPPKVEPWKPVEIILDIYFFTIVAPMGMPEPRPFAEVMISGLTP